VAALDALAARTGGPLAVVGYSFGAAVGIDTHDDRVAAVVAIAPPLSMMQVGQPSAPVLVLAPQHDQFTTPDDSAAIVAGWPHAQFRVIDAADHLLVGRAQLVARTAGDWLDAHR
jgi:alpha/beta superfamily hydrolase